MTKTKNYIFLFTYDENNKKNKDKIAEMIVTQTTRKIKALSLWEGNSSTIQTLVAFFQVEANNKYQIGDYLKYWSIYKENLIIFQDQNPLITKNTLNFFKVFPYMKVENGESINTSSSKLGLSQLRVGNQNNNNYSNISENTTIRNILLDIRNESQTNPIVPKNDQEVKTNIIPQQITIENNANDNLIALQPPSEDNNKTKSDLNDEMIGKGITNKKEKMHEVIDVNSAPDNDVNMNDGNINTKLIEIVKNIERFDHQFGCLEY